MDWMYCPADIRAIRAVLEALYAEPRQLRTRLHRVPPHRLASVLMVFALALTFTNRPGTTPLFSAASALLCVPEQHFMIRHSVAAVETLHLQVSYLFALGRPDAAKAAWPILGLCVRIACAMGLHRDPKAWNLSEDERNHRARLWWECATYDIL